MTRSLRLAALGALAAATLAAGCGGGDGGSSSSAKTKQRVASCKRSVNQARSLSAEVKRDLRKLCEKAASGNKEEIRKATAAVCVKIVDENVPKGPSREQAEEACRRENGQ